MNLRKVEMTIKQALEQHLEDEECPQIQEKHGITLMNKEDQNALTVTHTGIQQENARSQRRVGKQESATNMTK